MTPKDQVRKLLAAGKSHREIAAKMQVAEGTVKVLAGLIAREEWAK